ncbi:MAG: lactate racemase domain-containing protein [Desulfocapsaceae bacterium]
MEAVNALIKDIRFPPVYKVRQTFTIDPIDDIETSCLEQIAALARMQDLKQGSRIAVAVGSRGIADISLITASVVKALKQAGLEPFIVSGMASHGRATAEGQAQLLGELGVTEAAVGCPIRASVEVVEIGAIDSGLPVYMDKIASEADGIVVINRIKTHTAFHAPYESGLVKMLAIGLGNDIGAKSCHQLGFGKMAEHIIAMTEMKLAKLPVLFGVAVIEDGAENVSKIEIVDRDDIMSREPELLKLSKSYMPSIGIDQIDVLVVDRMGKEISGDGMDPNITGRYATPYATGGPTISKLAILSVTEKSHGNVIGVGQADICTRRLYEAADLETTYVNSLIATVTSVARLPMILPTDLDAVKAAILTCNIHDFSKVRLVRIRDTLHLGELLVSEALVDEVSAKPNVTSVEGPLELKFKNGTIEQMF